MTTLDSSLFTPGARVPAPARLLFALLERLAAGRVEVTGPDGVWRTFGPGGAPAPGVKAVPAVLALSDWQVAANALKGGDVAFAEDYMRGRWTTPDLTQLLTVLAANQHALEQAFYGRWWTRGLLRLKHWRNANTRRQARRNIVAHYDLGNDFYRLWLDPTMTYSAALFDGEHARPLADAQHAKYGRMLGELALPAGGRELEIGCGWGGFAEAAARAGHHVTGLSLSDAQTAWARERVAAAGLSERCDLRIQDYEFPRMAGLGFAISLPGDDPRFSFGMDYTFINWHDLGTFKVRLSNGNNPNLDIMTSPTIPVRVPLRLKDQHVIALGLSALVLRGQDLVEGVPKWGLTLRTGYNYAASAAPRRTTLPQLPIIAEHHISAGMTFHWGPLIDISFAWEWALPREIDISFHEGDFTLSNSQQEVDIMLFHLGLGVNF